MYLVDDRLVITWYFFHSDIMWQEVKVVDDEGKTKEYIDHCRSGDVHSFLAGTFLKGR